jgi:hypothetical protein
MREFRILAFFFTPVLIGFSVFIWPDKVRPILDVVIQHVR